MTRESPIPLGLPGGDGRLSLAEDLNDVRSGPTRPTDPDPTGIRGRKVSPAPIRSPPMPRSIGYPEHMSTTITETELADLLRQTGERHHAAFIESDGADPEWALWYADYVQAHLWDRAGRLPSRGELVYCSSAPSVRTPHRAVTSRGRISTPATCSRASHRAESVDSYPVGERDQPSRSRTLRCPAGGTIRPMSRRCGRALPIRREGTTSSAAKWSSSPARWEATSSPHGLQMCYHSVPRNAPHAPATEWRHRDDLAPLGRGRAGRGRARDRAQRRPPRRPTDDLPAHPALGRRAGPHDVERPVQQEARAPQGQPARLARAQRPGRARRPHRSRHDPGPRARHRRRPAHGVGAGPARSGPRRSRRSSRS